MHVVRFTAVSVALVFGACLCGQPNVGQEAPKAPDSIVCVPFQALHQSASDYVNGVVFNRNRTVITAQISAAATRHLDSRLVSWDVATGKRLRELKSPIRKGAISGSHDSKHLVTLSDNRREIVLLDIESGREIRRAEASDVPLEILCFLPDGKNVVVVEDASRSQDFENAKAWRWDLTTGKRGTAIPFSLRDYRRHRLQSSPDGKWFSLAGITGLTIIDANTGKALFDRPDGVAAGFSPDGKLFAFGLNSENRVDVYKTDTWKRVQEITWADDQQFDPLANPRLQPEEIRSSGNLRADFSMDGRSLILTCFDHRIAIAELATGQFRYRFDRLGAWIHVDPHTPLFVVEFHYGNDHGLVLIDPLNPTNRKELEQSREELLRCMKKLNDEQATVAFEGISLLARNPKQAIPLLRSTLNPAPKPDVEQVSRWIAQLDDDDFDTREKAQKLLREHDVTIRTALQAARPQPRSLDAANRLQQLLDEIENPLRPTRLKVIRGVELLEYFGTEEAIVTLRSLAKGVPGAVSTDEAIATLNRLQHRKH